MKIISIITLICFFNYYPSINSKAHRLSLDLAMCEIMKDIFSEEIFYKIKRNDFFGADSLAVYYLSKNEFPCEDICWTARDGSKKNITFQRKISAPKFLNISKEYKEAIRLQKNYWILTEVEQKGNLILITLFRPISNVQIFVAYKRQGNDEFILIDSTYGIY